MTFTEEELKLLEDIPQGKKYELLKFARSLKKSEAAIEAEDGEGLSPKPVRHGGWAKGKIWMSDDFNDPMDFVSEDEAKVLEVMREYKRKVQEKSV